jgi:predicted signal transduction protein with EAL and GGDEF domain
LALLFFTSVRSTLSSIIIHGNLREIELQTRALATREAEQRELSVCDHLTQLFSRRCFVLVMPEASLAATRLCADRLWELVRRLELEYNGHPLGTITIWAEAALHPDHGSSVEALLQSVDQALYRAKDAGRN